MKMQARLMVSAVCFTTMSIAGAAEYDDYGRVLRVVPQVEQYNQPRQECRTEYVPAPQPSRSVGGAILGGLAGGLLGHQIGAGNGRTAATAAGAITGAVVGDRIDNDRYAAAPQEARECRTVDHWQTRTSGYAVTYDYQGRSYTSVMPYDPGERVRLRISIAPRP